METSRDIDVRLLRAFVAVADTGRMTTAARVVSLSQGAVSSRSSGWRGCSTVSCSAATPTSCASPVKASA